MLLSGTSGEDLNARASFRVAECWRLLFSLGRPQFTGMQKTVDASHFEGIRLIAAFAAPQTRPGAARRKQQQHPLFASRAERAVCLMIFLDHGLRGSKVPQSCYYLYPGFSFQPRPIRYRPNSAMGARPLRG